MTFTYTPPVDGIFAEARDEVRYLARDTVETAQSASDEEIAYLLRQWDNDVYASAAALAMNLANSYDRLAASSGSSKKVGDLNIAGRDYSLAATSYRALAEELRRRGSAGTSIPLLGLPHDIANGPVFTLGQHDFPGVGLPT